MVRQMAVRGELTRQDPVDGSGLEEIEQAAEVLREMARVGDVKRLRATAPIDSASVPYEIPASWRFARLGDVAAVFDFMRAPVNKEERSARIEGKAPEALFPYFGATQQAGWIDDYLFDEELVLLGEDAAPFLDPRAEVAYVVDGKSWVNNHAHVLRGIAVTNKFLCLALNCSDYTDFVAGTTRLKLTQRRMVDLLIPVPPAAEQHRITGVAEELLEICAGLEERKALQSRALTRLRQASFSNLAAASDDAEAVGAWGALQENWGVIADGDPSDLETVQDAVLHLAVTGRLTAALPSDGRAEEQVGAIGAWVASESKAGRLLRPSRDKAGEVDSRVVEVRADWHPVLLRDLCQLINGDRGKNYPSQSSLVAEGVPFINAGHLQEGRICFDDMNFITPGHYERLNSGKIVSGDVIYCLRGSLGKAAMVGDGESGAIASSLVLVRPHQGIDPEYLLLYFQSPLGREMVSRFDNGSAQPNLSAKNLGRFTVPFPPLDEQVRIVVKVRELLELCTGLRASLERREIAAQELAQAMTT